MSSSTLLGILSANEVFDILLFDLYRAGHVVNIKFRDICVLIFNGSVKLSRAV